MSDYTLKDRKIWSVFVGNLPTGGDVHTVIPEVTLTPEVQQHDGKNFQKFLDRTMPSVSDSFERFLFENDNNWASLAEQGLTPSTDIRRVFVSLDGDIEIAILIEMRTFARWTMTIMTAQELKPFLASPDDTYMWN